MYSPRRFLISHSKALVLFHNIQTEIFENSYSKIFVSLLKQGRTVLTTSMPLYKWKKKKRKENRPSYFELKHLLHPLRLVGIILVTLNLQWRSGRCSSTRSIQFDIEYSSIRFILAFTKLLLSFLLFYLLYYSSNRVTYCTVFVHLYCNLLRV